MIMENNKLVEKHAASLGLNDLKITWQTFGGSGLMQSAMIAGRLDFASSGVPWFLTMWDKLNGQVIALPAVKSSIQAITLQMAAAAMFGAENAAKLDPLTVPLSHP